MNRAPFRFILVRFGKVGTQVMRVSHALGGIPSCGRVPGAKWKRNTLRWTHPTFVDATRILRWATVDDLRRARVDA